MTLLTGELNQLESRLRRRRRTLEALQGEGDPPDWVAQSAAMRRVLELTRRVAQVDSTVLITGESGVGKERVARLIHDLSSRTGGPFIAINCGAVSESLLESELFGHTRGAFTGATRDRVGLFEAAAGGTLLLDEIGDVSPSMQVKLLRVLQEREVRRLGENHSRPLNLRILAATNRDLGAETRAARFRQDLYYRLRVIEIEVPPLRSRREDILPLARTLLARSAADQRRRSLGFTVAAANQLVSYAWPGNVRELENAMERATALASGSRIDSADLPPEIGLGSPRKQVAAPERTLAEVEREHIEAVLAAVDGNRNQAAASLGIGVATLYRKLKSYGDPPEEGP